MKRKIFTLILSVVCFGFVAKAVVPDIYLSGTFNSWAVADPLYKLVANANGVLTIQQALPAGSHQFKLTDGTWNTSIAVSRDITLTAPKTINIYAMGSKKFVCDTQDTLYMTGGATGNGGWGAANMLQITFNGQQATALTQVYDQQQGNMYRKVPATNDPNWQEQVWSKPDYSGGNYMFFETIGANRTVVFDFATYTMTLAPQERFDLAYTLDGTTWLTSPLNDDPNSTDLLKATLTLPADITSSKYCVKYSQDGASYPAAIEGFTVIKNINALATVTAGVANTFQVSRSSANPNWDLAVSTNTTLIDVLNDKLSYSINNKQITVNAENKSVELFAVSGQKLANTTVNGAYTFTVKQSGVYLLRSNGTSYKVIIK